MSDEVRVAERGTPLPGEAGVESGLPPPPIDDKARIRALEQALARAEFLLHEADHRAKNTLQVVNSLVLLQARRIAGAPEPRVLYAIAERINALSLVHRLLAEDESGQFPLSVFLRELADELRVRSRDVEIAFDLAPLAVPAAKAPSLGLLLHEVLANALQHAFPGGAGRIAVSLSAGPEGCVVVVADDGVGSPEPAREGFGLMLVGLLGRQLRATVTREPAAPGTRVTIALPMGA